MNDDEPTFSRLLAECRLCANEEGLVAHSKYGLITPEEFAEIIITIFNIEKNITKLKELFENNSKICRNIISESINKKLSTRGAPSKKHISKLEDMSLFLSLLKDEKGDWLFRADDLANARAKKAFPRIKETKNLNMVQKYEDRIASELRNIQRIRQSDKKMLGGLSARELEKFFIERLSGYAQLRVSKKALMQLVSFPTPIVPSG